MQDQTLDKENLAYVIGLAIGDGNLTNPNCRAVRLRISCDTKYPGIQKRIVGAITKLLPENKIHFVYTPRNCIDISCYSNKLEGWLGWKAKGGSKQKQSVRVPKWIKQTKKYSIACLRGLIETDGSIYNDRGYIMVNFVTIIPELAKDVMEMIQQLGFKPHVYHIKIEPPRFDRYNIRISKNTQEFIDTIQILKN